MRGLRHRHRELADREILRHLTILSVLPDAVLDDLVTRAWTSYYRRGEEIDWQEEGKGLVLGVVQGVVDVSFLSVVGKELSVLEVDAGHHLELGTESWAGTDATIATVCSPRALVCAFPHAAFEEAVVHCPRAVHLLWKEHDRWLRALGGTADDRLHPPGDRLRHLLWRDTHDMNEPTVSYTHERLAARLGTTRSIVTTEMGRLVRAKIVGVLRGEHQIKVLDRERLADD